jgi:hypothetical protein
MYLATVKLGYKDMDGNIIQGSGVKRSPVAPPSSAAAVQSASLRRRYTKPCKLRPLLNLLWSRHPPLFMVEGCRDFGLEEFLLLLGHTTTSSPAFPGECSRKPILYITLYYYMYKVKRYFTIHIIGVEYARLTYTTPLTL